MGTRAWAAILAVAVLGGAGAWSWSNYCEAYDLCYPACRVASNGVESAKRLAPLIRRSEPVAATASPGSECLALLEVTRAEHPGKIVAIDTVNMAGERKAAAFHRYDCTFNIREPVFYLARNAECPAPAR